MLVALPDIFGWRDRINVPSSVNDENWTWRLPWPVETLTHVAGGARRAPRSSVRSRPRATEPGTLNQSEPERTLNRTA